MENTLRLQENAVIFSVSELPMVGNLDTGGVIGLTAEGAELCEKLAEEGLLPDEVPESCSVLVDHLARGGYLASPHPTVPRQPVLTSAYLHVTQRCNLSCRFCYSEDDSRNTIPDPSLDNLLRAIGLLASMGCKRLVISGGEPFLRDDLDGIASHAKARGIDHIAILTNGIFVTRKRLKPLRGLVDSIAVAFDGCSQDSPAYLRGEQRFDRLVEALRAIGDCGIEPIVLPTIHAQNLDDIPRYRELATNLGARVQFSLLTASSADLGSFALDGEHLRKLAALSLQEGAAVQDSAIGGPTAVRRCCGAGVRTLSVAADGTVYPCHMLHMPKLAMGNAFVDTAEQVCLSEVARSFEALCVDSFESCMSCKMRYLCGGGCRARALFDTDSIEGFDAYCELSRLYFRERFESLRRRYETA